MEEENMALKKLNTAIKEEIRMMKEENRRIEEEKLVEKKLNKGKGGNWYEEGGDKSLEADETWK